MITVAFVVCLLCNELLRPSQPKKSKKKSLESKHKEYVIAVAEKLKREMNTFCVILEKWTDSSGCLIPDFTERLAALNLSAEDVSHKVLASYTIANKEIQLILKTKIKTLNGIVG